MEKLRISWYVVFFLVGIIAGGCVCLPIKRRDEGRKERLIEEKQICFVDLLCCYLFQIIGMCIGAKLLYLCTNPDRLTVHGFDDIVEIVFTGFSYYGGIFGGILAVAFACLGFRLPIRVVMEKLSGSYPMIYACAKIGCGITGCCYGKAYEGMLAIVSPSGVSRFPIQFVDAFVSMLVVVCLCLYRRKRDRNATDKCFREKGSLMLFFFLHAIERLILDFGRADLPKNIGGVCCVNQIISLVLVAGCIFRWVINTGRRVTGTC